HWSQHFLSSFVCFFLVFFFFQAEDGIRDRNVTGVQTCALPISMLDSPRSSSPISSTSALSRGVWMRRFAAIVITGSYWEGTSVGRLRTLMSRQIPDRVFVWPASQRHRESNAASVTSSGEPRSEERRVGRES